VDDEDNSFRKINAIIQGKLHINLEEIKDVDEWIEAYSRADYLMKLDKTLMYASTKQAITEIMNEMFSKQNSEYQIQ
jgi:hypothetical protein